jgi:hypothetical protein
MARRKTDLTQQPAFDQYSIIDTRSHSPVIGH